MEIENEIKSVLPVTKWCNNCENHKKRDEFSLCKTSSDGLQSFCKKCRSKIEIKYRKTLDGALNLLLRTSKSHANERTDKGRQEAGVHTISTDFLRKQYEKQSCKCYWSGIKMTFEGQWKMSLERLDPTKGYTEENSVLCCLELNGQMQWSDEKFREMITTLNQGVTKNLVIFNLQEKHLRAYKKSTKRTCRYDNVLKEYIDVDDEYSNFYPDLTIECYNCTWCYCNRPVDEFLKQVRSGCKSCRFKKQKELNDTPRRCLQTLVNNVKKYDAKQTERNLICDIDFDYLVELFNYQKGLCKTSRMPLQFGSCKEKSWVTSLDRIDNTKGHCRGNVSLVCLEFNTTDNTSKFINNEYYDASLGHTGWNIDKFNFFFEYIKKKYE
jgi:hypothetical protein